MTELEEQRLEKAQKIKNGLEVSLNTALVQMSLLGHQHAFCEEIVQHDISEINLAEKHPAYKPEKPVEELKKDADWMWDAQKKLSEEAMDLDVLIKALEDAIEAAEIYEKRFLERKYE